MVGLHFPYSATPRQRVGRVGAAASPKSNHGTTGEMALSVYNSLQRVDGVTSYGISRARLAQGQGSADPRAWGPSRSCRLRLEDLRGVNRERKNISPAQTATSTATARDNQQERVRDSG